MRRAVAVVLPLVLVVAFGAAFVAAPALVEALIGPEAPEEATSGSGGAYAADPLNLRDGPSLDSAIRGVIPAGTVLTLAGEGRNGFVPVVYQGQRGWVYAAYVGPTGVTTVAGVAVATTRDAVHLRIGPAPNDPIRSVIPAGAIVVVTGDAQDGIVPVAFDGVPGFVAAEYLSLE